MWVVRGHLQGGDMGREQLQVKDPLIAHMTCWVLSPLMFTQEPRPSRGYPPGPKAPRPRPHPVTLWLGPPSPSPTLLELGLLPGVGSESGRGHCGAGHRPSVLGILSRHPCDPRDTLHPARQDARVWLGLPGNRETPVPHFHAPQGSPDLLRVIPALGRAGEGSPLHQVVGEDGLFHVAGEGTQPEVRGFRSGFRAGLGPAGC